MARRVSFLVDEKLLAKFDDIAQELGFTRTDLLIALMRFLVNVRENPRLVQGLMEYLRGKSELEGFVHEMIKYFKEGA